MLRADITPQVSSSGASPAKAQEAKLSYVERWKTIVGGAFTYDGQEAKKTNKEDIFEELWGILTGDNITPTDFENNFQDQLNTLRQDLARDKQTVAPRKLAILDQIVILYRIAYALDLKNQQEQASKRYIALEQKSILDRKAKLLSSITQDEKKVAAFTTHLNTYKEDSETAIAEYKAAIENVETKKVEHKKENEHEEESVETLQTLLEKQLAPLQKKYERECKSVPNQISPKSSREESDQASPTALIKSPLEQMQELKKSISDFRRLLDAKLTEAAKTLHTQYKTKLQTSYKDLSSRIGGEDLSTCHADILTHQREATDLLEETKLVASGFLSKDALEILKSTHLAATSLGEKKSDFDAKLSVQSNGFWYLPKVLASKVATGADTWKKANEFQHELFKGLESIGGYNTTISESLQNELQETPVTIDSADEATSTEATIKSLATRANALPKRLSDTLTEIATTLFDSKAISVQPIADVPLVLSSPTDAIALSADDAKKKQQCQMKQKWARQIVDFTRDITFDEETQAPPKLLKEFYERLDKAQEKAIKKSKRDAKSKIELQLTTLEKQVDEQIAKLQATVKNEKVDSPTKVTPPVSQTVAVAPPEYKREGTPSYYKWCASSIFASLASATSTTVVMFALAGMIATNPIGLIALTITSFLCGAIAYAAYRKAQAELTKVGACLFAQSKPGKVLDPTVMPVPVKGCRVTS